MQKAGRPEISSYEPTQTTHKDGPSTPTGSCRKCSPTCQIHFYVLGSGSGALRASFADLSCWVLGWDTVTYTQKPR